MFAKLLPAFILSMTLFVGSATRAHAQDNNALSNEQRQEIEFKKIEALRNVHKDLYDKVYSLQRQAIQLGDSIRAVQNSQDSLRKLLKELRCLSRLTNDTNTKNKNSLIDEQLRSLRLLEKQLTKSLTKKRQALAKLRGNNPKALESYNKALTTLAALMGHKELEKPKQN